MTLPRRFASPVLSLLLVFTMVAAGPMSGTAAADTTVSTNCGLDDAIRGLYSTIDPEVDCGLYDDTASDLSEQDAYANALAMADSRESYVTSQNNLNQDLRGILWMRGKAAAIRAYNNGSNESEVQSAFDSAVYDYLTMSLTNDLNRITADANQLVYLAAMTGGSNTTDGSQSQALGSTYQKTYKMPNGTTHTVQLPLRYIGGGTGVRALRGLAPEDTSHPENGAQEQLVTVCCNEFTGYDPGEMQEVSESWEHGDLSAGGEPELYFAPQGETLSHATSVPSGSALAWNTSEYRYQIHLKILIGKQITSNGEAWVSGVFSEYERGEIEPADLWDPVTLAQEASTEYNSTGYYSFANSELAALGLAGDTNVSHVIETQYTVGSYNPGDNQTNASYQTTTYNATIEGTLFLSGGDSLSIENGETYDPANMSGTPYMTVATATDSNGDPIEGVDNRIEVTEPFTATSATNTRTGESVNVTTAENKNYQTANATLLESQIDELLAERQRLQEERSSWGAGGDSNNTNTDPKRSGLDPRALVLIVAGAAVLGLLLQRDGDR